MPYFEETCQILKGTSISDFRALHANALKARKYKRCTPLQEAILTYATHLRGFLRASLQARSQSRLPPVPRAHASAG